MNKDRTGTGGETNSKIQFYTELGVGLLTLVTTSGTLVCCAIPVLLVALGMGAAVSGLVGSLPFLVTLTHYKIYLFVISAALLGIAGWLMFRPGRTCPSDPDLSAICEKIQNWSRGIYWGSIVLWGIGFFASYLLLPLRVWVGF